MCRSYQGSDKAQGGQAQDPKELQVQLTFYIAHPKLRGVLMPTSPRILGSASQRPKSSFKPKLSLGFQLQLRFSKMPKPEQRPLSAYGRRKERYDPWTLICMRLVFSCPICIHKPEAEKKKNFFRQKMIQDGNLDLDKGTKGIRNNKYLDKQKIIFYSKFL